VLRYASLGDTNDLHLDDLRNQQTQQPSLTAEIN